MSGLATEPHRTTRKKENKERFTNNLDKTICSLAGRGTTKSAKMKTGKILFKEQGYRIIGACFEVYKEKGNGFLEARTVRQSIPFACFAYFVVPKETAKNVFPLKLNT